MYTVGTGAGQGSQGLWLPPDFMPAKRLSPFPSLPLQSPTWREKKKKRKKDWERVFEPNTISRIVIVLLFVHLFSSSQHQGLRLFCLFMVIM